MQRSNSSASAGKHRQWNRYECCYSEWKRCWQFSSKVLHNVSFLLFLMYLL